MQRHQKESWKLAYSFLTNSKKIYFKVNLFSFEPKLLKIVIHNFVNCLNNSIILLADLLKNYITIVTLGVTLRRL